MSTRFLATRGLCVRGAHAFSLGCGTSQMGRLPGRRSLSSAPIFLADGDSGEDVFSRSFPKIAPDLMG